MPIKPGNLTWITMAILCTLKAKAYLGGLSDACLSRNYYIKFEQTASHFCILCLHLHTAPFFFLSWYEESWIISCKQLLELSFVSATAWWAIVSKFGRQRELRKLFYLKARVFQELEIETKQINEFGNYQTVVFSKYVYFNSLSLKLFKLEHT